MVAEALGNHLDVIPVAYIRSGVELGEDRVKTFPVFPQRLC